MRSDHTGKRSLRLDLRLETRMRLAVLLGQREMRTWRQEVKARVSRYATGVYIYNGCPCAAKGTMPWINKEV